MHEQARMKFDTNLYLFFKGESTLQITKRIKKPWKEPLMQSYVHPLLKLNKPRPEKAAVPGPYDQLAQRKQSKDDVNSTTYGTA